MADLTPHGDANSPCPSNPEVAGVGVIAAFGASACLTLLVSAICLVFKAATPREAEDERRGVRKTSDTDSQAMCSPRTNAERWRRYMKTERTKGSDVVQWISHPTREPVIVWANCSPERQEKVRIWHRVLDTILLGLSLNQLVAGLGLWTCTVIAFQFKSGDPHAVLAYNMSAASSFSQLQIPYVLHKQGKARRSDRRIARLRRHLFDINLLLLLLSAVVQTEETHNPSAMIGFAVALFFSYYARLVASQRVADYMDRKTKALEHTKWSRRPLHASLRGCRMLFRKFDTSPVSRTMCSFSISAGFTLWALVVVIRLKLFPHRFGYTNCDLNTEDENRWTFGQILAVLMIVAIVLPGFDTYFEEVEAARDRKKSRMRMDFQSHVVTTTLGPLSYGHPSSYAKPSSPANSDDSTSATTPTHQSAQLGGDDDQETLKPNLRPSRVSIPNGITIPSKQVLQSIRDKESASTAIDSAVGEAFAPPKRRTTTRLESQD